MTQHIYVKPVGGKKIRDEYTLAHIPPAGAWVKPTRFVTRRIAEKDLERAEPPAAPEPAAATEAPSTEAAAEATEAPSTEPAAEATEDSSATDRPRRRGKHESEG